MQRPDIILLVLDTQRADRLGCYGYERGTTPNLDAFADGATLFEHAIAPAQWTVPSHASMFTGRYPTAHGVLQSHHSISPDLPHVAELLRASGYETIGFCNNPLVGVLNNGFKRGFQTFYNYGGAVPSVPDRSSPLPWPLNHLHESYTQFLRRISYPVQNFFGRSDLAFRIFLNAWLTPLWSRLANFKGQNERSVKDVIRFLAEREARPRKKPLFLFINLMETHLPFWPPAPFIDRVAPYFREDKEARTIMRRWNREAYRWAAPLAEPLGELESRVLNDLYDAEVAYQDDYLGRLFEVLSTRGVAEDTLTLVVADHGDSLGDHGYMGHAFVAYQELVHVPLVTHWPRRLPAGRRVKTPVSTRRIFHTILDASGDFSALPELNPGAIRPLSLVDTVYGQDAEMGHAFAEVYPPMNFVKAIKHRQPHLLEQFRCLSTRRALVHDNLKLIEVDEKAEELFALDSDRLELNNLLRERPADVALLENLLQRISARVAQQRESLATGGPVELDMDERLLQQLRGLGYIE